jgi:hypothetical protein
MTNFYEKVVKVKADVAAILNFFCHSIAVDDLLVLELQELNEADFDLSLIRGASWDFLAASCSSAGAAAPTVACSSVTDVMIFSPSAVITARSGHGSLRSPRKASQI